jgi:hypothetical protein
VLRQTLCDLLLSALICTGRCLLLLLLLLLEEKRPRRIGAAVCGASGCSAACEVVSRFANLVCDAVNIVARALWLVLAWAHVAGGHETIVVLSRCKIQPPRAFSDAW